MTTTSKRTTRVAVRDNVIEVTPGDGVNPKTLGDWVAENVTLPVGEGLVLVRVTTWYPRWVAPEAVPHPAPEIACRVTAGQEIPRGALTVRKAALGAGWSVVATYARGTQWTRSGPGAVVDSLALRMRRGLLAAVAVWVSGRFDFGMRWGEGVRPESLGAKELTAWLVA